MNGVSAAAALVFAYYGVLVLGGVVAIARTMRGQTGGAGAVSANIEGMLFAVIACLVANRLLARAAGRAEGLVKRLHRAHSIAFAAAFVSLALGILLIVTQPSRAVLVGVLLVLGGVLAGVQFCLLSAALIALILRRPSAANAP